MGTRMQSLLVSKIPQGQSLVLAHCILNYIYIKVQHWNNRRTNETAATKQKQCEHPRHLRDSQIIPDASVPPISGREPHCKTDTPYVMTSHA